jgi:hypothetical protein
MAEPAECFICTGRDIGERPHEWLEMRFACPQHKATARLPNGMLVEDFIATHTGSHQFEGSGLGYLLNPVEIGGARGFTDWAGGGWAVIEEVYPSANFFEFGCLHARSGVEVLFALFQAKESNSRSNSEPTDVVSRAAKAAHDAQRFWQDLYDVMSSWNTQTQIDGELARRGRNFCRDADEAEAVFHAAGSSFPPQAMGNEGFRVLLGLADRRFRHLLRE